jgi:hypothetical protein
MKIQTKTIFGVISIAQESPLEATETDGESIRNRLKAFLGGLSHQELIELMAVMSVGRGDPGSDNFQALVDNIHLAAARIVEYLSEKPHLAEDIEKGMRKLGISGVDE